MFLLREYDQTQATHDGRLRPSVHHIRVLVAPIELGGWVCRREATSLQRRVVNGEMIRLRIDAIMTFFSLLQIYCLSH